MVNPDHSILRSSLTVLQGSSRSRFSEDYRNPASPEIVNASPSWDRPDGSRTATPTASSASSLNHIPIPGPIVVQSSLPTIPASRTTSVPNSPTRARSTGDLLCEQSSRYNEPSEVNQPTIEATISTTSIDNENANVDHSPTSELSPPTKVENKDKEM